METFAALEEKVLAWANERKIIDVDAHRQMYLQVLKTQTLKLCEEVGELNGAIWRKAEGLGNESAIIDAIGDSLVVLTSIVWALPPLVMKNDLRYRLDDLYEEACEHYNEPNSPLLLLNSEVGVLASDVLKNRPGEDMRIAMLRILIFLKYVCYEHLPEKSLIECYEAAYEAIKDRKGKTTTDGNFIKEGD